MWFMHAAVLILVPMQATTMLAVKLGCNFLRGIRSGQRSGSHLACSVAFVPVLVEALTTATAA
jgi:hypothetical protein